MRTVARGLTDFQSGYATWSPDHRYLAWGDGGITIRDVAKGTERQLNRGQSLSMPAWSTDGTRIAFGDSTQLWIARTDGSHRVGLAAPPALAPLAVTWAPGRLLAFEGLQLDCVDAPSCVSTDRSEIWTIRPDGTGLRRLTHVGHAENPKWSPSGTDILFIRRFPLSKTPRSELWAIAANGTGARRLVAVTNVLAAAWSPSAQQIAMVRAGTIPNTLQVWIAAADGTNAHPVGQIVRGTDATIDW
jgi:Tol biopolymer transport system component